MSGISAIPLVGPIIDYFMNQDAENKRQRLIDAERARLNELKLPEFSNSQYNAMQFGRPEEAQGQTISLQPGTRDAQMKALQNMLDQSRGLSDSGSDLSRFKAIQEANQLASSRDQAAQSNARARGVGGGGLEFAMRQQGGQDAANRAQDAGMQGAYQQALQRMQAQNNYIAGLGNLRNQDTDLASRNADVINKFNMYNVGARNAANQSNVQMGNQGQMYNLQRGDSNTMSKYGAAVQKQMLSQQLLNPSIRSADAGSAGAKDAIGGYGDMFEKFNKLLPLALGAI